MKRKKKQIEKDWVRNKMVVRCLVTMNEKELYIFCYMRIISFLYFNKV